MKSKVIRNQSTDNHRFVDEFEQRISQRVAQGGSERPRNEENRYVAFSLILKRRGGNRKSGHIVIDRDQSCLTPSSYYRMQGIGIIRVLVLIPIMLTLLLALIFAFYEGRKAYWDYQVREMCEKDGGITAHERIRITAEDYRRLSGTQGEIPIPERRSANATAEFVSVTQEIIIRKSNPQVWRRETAIQAVDGDRLLARYVSYARVGGDFPTIAHPSSLLCNQEVTSISKRIFILQGAEE